MESKLRLEASLKDKMESKWRLDSPNGVQVALGVRLGGPKWRFEAIFEGSWSPSGAWSAPRGPPVALPPFPTAGPVRLGTTTEGMIYTYIQLTSDAYYEWRRL